jgi:hypothetical protein
MSFGKQQWICAAPECERQGAVSVVVIFSAPGGRKEREQANTKAVRLCTGHLRWFVEQQPIKTMLPELDRVGRQVVPKAWDEPKPKRIK